MKRLTSIFLVLAMLLTLAPMNIFAAETDKSVFSDMKDTDYYAQAATALEQLDILAGYPDGTFGAEKSITRAEMAAIVCRMIDKEADAEKAKGETAFDDVKSDHWASGYINIASKEGIINGDGNGKFRPEDDVKHEEAIKMVVCALGYGDDVEVDAKDWSKGYLKVADEKGISTALKGTKGKASTRGDVAVMSYNGLSVDLAAPTTSLESGSYRGTKSVKLSTTTEGAEIYYTTDGSTPTVKSTKYTKAISISKTCALKAITVKDGVLVSDVLSVDYTIKRSSGGGGSSRPSTPSTYTVSFDLNYEGATGAPASQTVNSGDKAFEPTAPERIGYAFVGWYVDNSFTELFDFANTTITADTTIYARWVDMADTTDTDGDGLTDPLEEFYGTDKTKIDTDEDELSDFVEISVLNLNALSNDTDENGTLDGDEDTDEDEIINKTEITNGTDPASKDTDIDGLTDKEEETYNTNPLNADTDDDGVSDSKEIELGTDPLVAQTTFSMNLSADNDGEGATASVQMNLSGEQVETLSIEPVENDTFFPEDMPGYMGQAYDFNVEGEFDSADISFEFDASQLGPDADPVIYYFNEETQELEELPTTINGNVATATVSHFSKYILVDRKVYQESFTWQDVWESDHNFTDIEIVFVVDDSGSMDWNDPSYERLAVARTLIDNLPTDSKIGLVRFDGGYPQTSALTPTLTTDKEVVKNYLTTEYFYNPGGTDMYNGIQKAFPLYESTEETTLKMMIVLSDGETDDTYLHSTVIATANENNIRIYTVGLGSSTSYFNNYMKPLANNTGAAFYLASDATQLADIYKDISEKIDIETDSDEDGIPDYYEDNMIIFNGVKLSLDKNNPDTDGDDLLDGEEVIITKEANEDGTKVKVTGKLVLGNPTKSDTDNDGYNDSEDEEPLDYTITDRTLAIIESLSYENLSAYVGDTVGYAIEQGVSFKGMTEENKYLLKDAVIIYSNHSGEGWNEFIADRGLGSIAIKINRSTKNDAVVYALRGSEFDDDLVNDAATDGVLGFGWDSAQSKVAFNEYVSIAKNKNVDYYITGHSLGGRLAQDVIYKVYNSNEGFLGTFNKTNIPEPVHSATFNSLGYNKLVYATLENDILEQYESKLTNFYYVLDLVGEGLGNAAIFSRAGAQVELLPKDISGTPYRSYPTGLFNLRDSDYHGIKYFVNDYTMLPSSYHDFNYWKD